MDMTPGMSATAMMSFHARLSDIDGVVGGEPTASRMATTPAISAQAPHRNAHDTVGTE